MKLLLQIEAKDQEPFEVEKQKGCKECFNGIVYKYNDDGETVDSNQPMPCPNCSGERKVRLEWMVEVYDTGYYRPMWTTKNASIYTETKKSFVYAILQAHRAGTLPDELYKYDRDGNVQNEHGLREVPCD